MLRIFPPGWHVFYVVQDVIKAKIGMMLRELCDIDGTLNIWQRSFH
jgi:hypothetical protein